MTERAAKPYESNGQQVLLAVVEALARNPLAPAPVSRLVEMVNGRGRAATRDQVFRALRNLEIADWAAEIPESGWRLTPRAVQLSERFRLAIADLHRQYLAGLPGVLDPEEEPERIA